MPEPSEIIVVLVAAGRGSRARMAESDLPKQYRAVAGRPILVWTANALSQADPALPILPVIGGEDAKLFASIGDLAGLLPPVVGGASRQQSVRAGLEALASAPPVFVLVHDAVRPFVSPKLTRAVVAALRAGSAAVVPATPPTDTLRSVADGAVVDRNGLAACQTPQGFRFAALLEAHRGAAAAGIDGLTDDAAVMEWAGHGIDFVEGDPANGKITTPADIELAALRLGGRAPRFETRIGQGYDVHRLVEGRPLRLGGLDIPYSHGLSGHSDADAALHVLTDALLGAIGDGDIGRHFPPSDAQWKDATSDRFLRFAASRVAARGGRIVHLDLTIIAEAPRIGPHVAAMRESIAAIAGTDTGRVSVKATTSEKLGFVGRSEGIAALGVASVEMPVE